MKIIDANTGHHVKIGEPFKNVDGTVTVLQVEEGWFTARALFAVAGRKYWAPLTVRFMHPGFLFKKVGFVNS